MNDIDSHHGAEWIYLKVYTGIRTADRILNEVLYPHWLETSVQKSATAWFFIRYSDPDFHLRFRLKPVTGSNASDHYDKIQARLAVFKRSNQVWKVVEAKYVPEYERYGKAGMQMAESIFCADSNAFMQFLMLESKQDEKARWLYSIAAINRLLEDFGYGNSEKKDLLLKLNRSFANEFGKDRKLASQLSERYRKYGRYIDEVLEDNLDPFHDILSLRTRDQMKAVKALKHLYDGSAMKIEQNKLLSSFIHMSMNRIFRNNNRLHEMVIYDLLFRHYKSMIHKMIV